MAVLNHAHYGPPRHSYPHQAQLELVGDRKGCSSWMKIVVPLRIWFSQRMQFLPFRSLRCHSHLRMCPTRGGSVSQILVFIQMHLDESCDPAKGQVGIWIITYILAVRVIGIGIRSPPRRLGIRHILMLVIGHRAWGFSRLLVAMFLGSGDGHQSTSTRVPAVHSDKDDVLSICYT